MLEVPSLAFAPNSFFKKVDFVMVGGNDLKQFFFAADRENERVNSERASKRKLGGVEVPGANMSSSPAAMDQEFMKKMFEFRELTKKRIINFLRG